MIEATKRWIVRQMAFGIIPVSTVAIVLVSCQSPQMAARMRYPQLEVTGAAAKQLSKHDIYEIVDIASKNPKMRKPIHRIDADTSTHAEVSGGGALSESETVLRVRKENGRWSSE
jgi:hypothetical protein